MTHCPVCDDPILRDNETIELRSRELAHVRCEDDLVQCVWCDEYATKHDASEHWTLDPETGNWYCPASRCQGGLKAERGTREREGRAEIDALLANIGALKVREERVALLEHLRDVTEEALRG